MKKEKVKVKDFTFQDKDKTPFNFTNSEFHGCNFSNVSGMDGFSVKATDSDFYHCNFATADLTGWNFSGCLLIDCNFNDCNLTDVDFSKANLMGSTFVNAQMERANMEDSLLFGVKLDSAKGVEVKLEQGNYYRIESELFQSPCVKVKRFTKQNTVVLETASGSLREFPAWLKYSAKVSDVLDSDLPEFEDYSFHEMMEDLSNLLKDNASLKEQNALPYPSVD